MFHDTIFALSTGRLPAGVAIIRLSGPHCRAVLSALTGRVPPPATLAYQALRSPDGDILDRGYVAFIPGPKSFTGEDCAELHVHGGKAVVAAVLSTLGAMHGLRHAESGEFTRRAFMLGKLDLLETEALADLIEAETEAQRRFAIANQAGGNAALYAAWRDQLLSARALLEADFDFSDEADVPSGLADQAWSIAAGLGDAIRDHLKGFRRAEIVREGYRVALVGAPNAGKSSLLNALARRDVAIVSDEPGTTRDLIEVALDLDGHKVVLTDTAGLRDTEGKVERLGIERSLTAAEAADLLLIIHDCRAGGSVIGEIGHPNIRKVASKVDLVSSRPGNHDIALSVVTGEGLSDLLGLIATQARAAADVIIDAVPFSERQRALLARALASVETAVHQQEAPTELRAEELRRAAALLSSIVGDIGVEDLLGSIFSRFCIGK